MGRHGGLFIARPDRAVGFGGARSKLTLAFPFALPLRIRTVAPHRGFGRLPAPVVERTDHGATTHRGTNQALIDRFREHIEGPEGLTRPPMIPGRVTSQRGDRPAPLHDVKMPRGTARQRIFQPVNPRQPPAMHPFSDRFERDARRVCARCEGLLFLRFAPTRVARRRWRSSACTLRLTAAICARDSASTSKGRVRVTPFVAMPAPVNPSRLFLTCGERG